MRTRARGNRPGFSLFETVVALVIVAMIAIYTLNAVGQGFDAAYRARRAIEMDALADQRLDYLDLLQATDLESLPDTLAAGTFDPPNNAYSWQMTSTPYSDQPGVFDVGISVIYHLGEINVYTVHTYVWRRAAVSATTSGAGGF